MKTKYEIIIEQWNEGSNYNKNRLSKDRLLIETYAYNCMIKLEQELKPLSTKNAM